jgi:hypothetical protein
MMVVPDPGRLHRDVKLDLLVNLLDPYAAVRVVLDDQRADHSVRLNLDDLWVLVPGRVAEHFHADAPST